VTAAAARESDREAPVPGGTKKPFRIVMGLLAICIIAAPLGVWIVHVVWRDVTVTQPVERLLADGSRLAADGFLDEAAVRFGEALAIDQHNAEVQDRILLCDFRRGRISRMTLDSELGAAHGESGPPAGFDDLIQAELAILDSDLDKARALFESALARCGPRLRFDVLHSVDHLKEWAATERFCLCARFPSVEEKRKALTRVTFRPADPAWLTLFLCAPSIEPRLVFPRGRHGDDVLRPAGTDLLVEFFRDSGEWIFLPAAEAFLCALALPDPPDRERVQAILEEVSSSGGGAREAAAALEKEFGAHCTLTLGPQP